MFGLAIYLMPVFFDYYTSKSKGCNDWFKGNFPPNWSCAPSYIANIDFFFQNYLYANYFPLINEITSKFQALILISSPFLDYAQFHIHSSYQSSNIIVQISSHLFSASHLPLCLTLTLSFSAYLSSKAFTLVLEFRSRCPFLSLFATNRVFIFTICEEQR